MQYKYTTIVSQYYFSRHMFIVKHTEDFIARARNFADELMAYKRNKDDTRDRGEFPRGDLDYIKDDGVIRSRYNINDSGDIYFIQANYANYCMHVAMDFQLDTINQSKGYQKKQVTDAISEHHSYNKVKEIVEKHFEIV